MRISDWSSDVCSSDLRPALAATLRRVRERGYAVSRNERVLGATAIAVPLRDATGAAPYCLTMAGPKQRFVEREDALCATMLAAGEGISVRLGHGAEARVKGREDRKSPRLTPSHSRASGQPAYAWKKKL